MSKQTNRNKTENKPLSAKERTIKRRKLAEPEREDTAEEMISDSPSAEELSETPAEVIPETPAEKGLQETHSEDSGLFFEVPSEPEAEEPVFGELIFGEQISGKKVNVKLKADKSAKKNQKKEPVQEERFLEDQPEEDYPGEGLAEEDYPGDEYPEEYQEGGEPEDLPEDHEEEPAAEEPDEEELKRQREARRRRKEELKKELEEQLRKEKEEQQELEEALRKEKEKQAEKARKEKEKQEAKERREKARQEAKERREQIKQTAEYRRRVKIQKIVISIVVGILLIAAGIFLINRYAQLRQYTVISSIEMTNIDESSKIFKFHNGYVKCAGDGITYFDRNGIIWNESLSMADPLVDVCGDYIAVTDMKSTEVYVFGITGLLNKFSLTRVATGIEVSRYGSVAVCTNEGDSNYIELKDQSGKDIATVKTVFSSTGYVTDIALSPDGSKLAAAYILVADGNIESKVVFYDFSRNSNQGENVTIGEFDQYKSSLITTVEFMDGNRLAAVGDNAFTIYSVGNVPTIIYEDLKYPLQINSLFFSNRYIGFIVENTESEDAYAIKAYDLNGKLVCDQSFDFAYNHVAFAGDAVLLYSNYDCDVFNFAGTHKFSYTFDNRIFTLESCGDTINYILLLQGQTQFIRLR